MVDNTYKVDLSLTPRSKQDILAYRDAVRDLRNDITAATAALRNLSKLSKTLRVNAITGNTFGGDSYLRGTENRANRNANRTGFDGTAMGAQIDALKEQLRLGKMIEGSYKSQLANERAMQLQLGGKKQAWRDITDVQKLSKLQSDAELRANLESARAVQARAQAQIHAGTVLEKTYRRQTKAAEKNVQLARDMSAEIGKQIKSVQDFNKSPDARRAAKMDMLFGDGGAALFRIQAGLALNYAIMNGIRTTVVDSISFTRELDEALRNLQAIVVVTDGSMVDLKDSLITVSEQTKFTAVEVSQAAVTLGQAGLSVEEIKNSIGAVALLATATGTDLAKSVDIATSVLGVFNMESGQMGEVANTLTTAVNKSKLNIDKLTLGLQYAGNTASESGVTFEELTAGLGAMANSGIRAGSTLGTGMRQILIALQKPSTTFLEILERLDLTMADVDLQSNGLYGALRNLKDAGFTAADAFQAFEVRGAAAFAALDPEEMLRLEEAFVTSTAAAKANQTQMRAFNNVLKQFQSVVGSTLAIAIEPFMLLLRDMLKAISEQLVVWKEWESTIQGVGIVLIGLGSALATGLVGRLVLSLLSLGDGLKDLANNFKFVRKLAPAVGLAFTILTGKVGLLLRAIVFAGAAFLAFRRESKSTEEKLDDVQTEFDKSAGAAGEFASKIETVTGEIDMLNSRYDNFRKDSRLLETEILKVENQFGSMGFKVGETSNSIDALIENLKDLRDELSQEYIISLGIAGEKAQDLIRQQNVSASEIRGGINTRVTRMNESNAASGVQPDPDVVAAVSQILEVDRNSTGLLGPMLTLQKAQMKLEKLLENGTAEELAVFGTSRGIDTSGVGRESNRKLIEEVIKRELSVIGETLNDALTLRSIIGGREETQRKYDQTLIDANVATQSGFSNVEQIRSRLGGLGENQTQARFAEEMKPIASDEVILRGEKAQEMLDSMNREFDVMEERLKSMNLEPVLFDEINQRIFALRAEYEQTASTYIEAADKARLELLSREKAFVSSELDRARGRIENSNDPKLAYEEARDLAFRQFELKRDEILGNKDLDADSKRVDLFTARTDLTDLLDEINQDLKDREDVDFKELNELRLKTYENLKTLLQMDRRGSTDPEEIRRLADQERELLWSIADAETQALGKPEDMNDPSYLEAVKEIGIQMAQDVDTLNKDVNQQVESIIEDAKTLIQDRFEVARASYDIEDAKLQERLEDAGTLEEIEQITQQRKELFDTLIQSFAEYVRQLLERGISISPEEMDRVNSELYEVIARVFQDYENQRQNNIEVAQAAQDEADANELADIESDIEVAEALWDSVIDLAEEAKTIAERASYLERAAAIAADIATKARAALKIKGKKMSPTVFKNQGILLDLAEEDRADTITSIRNSPFDRDEGGGGDERSEVEKFIEKTEARLRATEALLKAELIDGATGLGTIRSIINDTEAKLREVEQKILGFGDKVNAGTLTLEEAEKLNELAQERESLTALEADSQKAIAAQLFEQGQYWQAITMMVKQYSTELSMFSAFEGILDVLSSVKSSFAELFRSLTDGSKNAGEAFKDFARSIIESIHNMISEMIAMYVMQQLIGMVFPTAGPPGSMSNIARTAAGLKEGGEVGGTTNRDSEAYMLMPGEYVLRRSAVQAVGVDYLDQLNAIGNRRMATGGHIGAAKPKGVGGEQNIWLVDERSKAPIPGPNDIIAVVSDDMMRNGVTKRLIKGIAGGRV